MTPKEWDAIRARDAEWDHPELRPGIEGQAWRHRSEAGTHMASDRCTWDAVDDRRALLAEVDRGCWRWQGALSDEGYGRLAGSRTEYAHRAAYRAFRGPIPADKQVDHLCRNRACVNPDHLELVTRKENILRGVSPSAVNARKTHCIRGHVIDGVNVKGRYCRTCNRDQQRRYRAAGATYPSDARYRHGGAK